MCDYVCTCERRIANGVCENRDVPGSPYCQCYSLPGSPDSFRSVQHKKSPAAPLGGAAAGALVPCLRCPCPGLNGAAWWGRAGGLVVLLPRTQLFSSPVLGTHTTEMIDPQYSCSGLLLVNRNRIVVKV